MGRNCNEEVSTDVCLCREMYFVGSEDAGPTFASRLQRLLEKEAFSGGDSVWCVTPSSALPHPILQSQINRKRGRRILFRSSTLGFVFMGVSPLESNYFPLLLCCFCIKEMEQF
jgi:hypothetical protein